MICASLSAQVLTRPPCHHSVPAIANLCPHLQQLPRGGAPPLPDQMGWGGGESKSTRISILFFVLHPGLGPESKRTPPSPPPSVSSPTPSPLPSAQPIRTLTPGVADKLFLSLALCLSLGPQRRGSGGEGEEMGSFMLSKARYINYKTAICRVKVC